MGTMYNRIGFSVRQLLQLLDDATRQLNASSRFAGTKRHVEELDPLKLAIPGAALIKLCLCATAESVDCQQLPALPGDDLYTWRRTHLWSSSLAVPIPHPSLGWLVLPPSTAVRSNSPTRSVSSNIFEPLRQQRSIYLSGSCPHEPQRLPSP